ncbi:MAG: hypothetical protein EBQ89_06645, partial [Alphaproteobacteria bacterium]|nr:hypothetical protein [Alphaproteobacteria bacterium]
LATFDARLQEKLQHMVNIFWLEELAESAHQSIIHLIQQHGAWHYQHHVPHLGMVLGSLEMLQNSGALAKKFSHQALKRRVAESFLEALAPLPSGGDDAFTHDLFIGLKIPTLNDDKHWVYMPEDVYTARAFNSLMRDVFSSFDGINLGGLASDTGFGTTRETMATTQHLHGYQGRLGEQTRQNYAAMAGFFSP